MLSISTPAKGAKRINYYVNSVFTEYYVGRGGAASHWAGNGAVLLGLHGEVHTKTLNQLARGYSPDGSIKLVQNAGHPDRQCFWDLTFSAPKGVSVMWALAPEPAQKVIEQCHNRAVEHALRFAEERAGLTRLRKSSSAAVSGPPVKSTSARSTRASSGRCWISRQSSRWCSASARKSLVRRARASARRDRAVKISPPVIPRLCKSRNQFSLSHATPSAMWPA